MSGSSLHLSGLHIYPIKALGGMTVDAWDIDDFGFRFDRRWMVVDGKGCFLTQRDHPRMALISVAIRGSRLELRAPQMPPLRLSLVPDEGEEVRVTVWRDQCVARIVEPSAEPWLGRVLDRPCRLVYLPDDSVRPLDPGYAASPRRVSFADAFPFLLIGAASLEELNRRLPHPLPMNRFRPNLTVAGGTPFAEDRWRRIAIGGLGFDVVKPCARCVVTTTDPRSGERSADREPLKTLASFRRRGGEVLFGQNLIHQGPGKIRLGGSVQVLAEGK